MVSSQSIAFRWPTKVLLSIATFVILSNAGRNYASLVSLERSSKNRQTRLHTLPYEDERIQNAYLQRLITEVNSNPAQSLSPAVQQMKDTIESTPHLYMQFTQMFNDVPHSSIGNDNETIRDYSHLLQLFNELVRTAPLPHLEKAIPTISTLLQHLGRTKSGLAAFIQPDVNMLIKGVLDDWADFVKGPDSRPYVKNGTEDGWLGTRSIGDIELVANLPYGTSSKFSDIFECEPQEEYYGFGSWDDFFTRRFRPGVRPVADPHDDDVIVNACESVPQTIAKAKLRDTFFVKGQPYSVLDMLGHDPVAYQFSDATVYQAHLNMQSYHRWHAPVSGRIHSAYTIDGTYFSVPQHLGFSGANQSDGDAFLQAMPYMSAMATRAVVIIEADNRRLGLVAFIAVGMVEVSTCEITVQKNQWVRKGDEMGLFHLGGSSYCLLFQDGVSLGGFPPARDVKSANIAVLSKIAVVLPPKLAVQA